MALDMVYEMEEEEDEDESGEGEEVEALEEGNEDPESAKEEGDVEPSYMGGKRMNWFYHMVPTTYFVGEDSSELFLLEVGAYNFGTSRGICGGYMGTYDVLRKVIGSDLGDEDFEEKIHLVSFKCLLSNYLHPHQFFSYFSWLFS